MNKIIITDEQREKLETGAMYTSLAYMLTDCADSCLMFAVDNLNNINCTIPNSRRQQLEYCKQILNHSRQVVNDTTKSLYECNEADNLIEITDWLLRCIIAIMKATQDDDKSKEKMIKYIKKFKP